MKAGANALGNQVLLVSVARVLELMDAVKACGSELSIVCIGLYPRNAEKIAVVGAIRPKIVTPNCGAPEDAAADASAPGRFETKTNDTMVKRMLVPII